MVLTSEAMNFLVYQYLHESGFEHTKFVFQHETQIDVAILMQKLVEPGMLVKFLQKGLLYTEIETHIANSEVGDIKRECHVPFTLLEKHACCPTLDDEVEAKRDVQETSHVADTADQQDMVDVVNRDGSDDENCTLQLTEHDSEVFVCAWNPVDPEMLVSGGGDATARIWTVDTGAGNHETTISSMTVLSHTWMNDHREITTLAWNPNGSLVATGTFTGQAIIWSKCGKLQFSLDKHVGPVLAVKWNPKGNLLLSVGCDGKAVVWQVDTGHCQQIFTSHQDACLDIDWLDDETFSTCSSDCTIHVCQVGIATPIKVFVGHTDEVNNVTWDATGQYLASASDDCTAKIWSLAQDRWLFNLIGHDLQVYSVKWAPLLAEGTGVASALVATASFDATVRVWDAGNGQCLHRLTAHSGLVYAICFSPNGKWLASGSFDRTLCIWSVEDGSMRKLYANSGGVFDCSWNSRGDRLAACLEDHTVKVLNMQALSA